jgi:integral membrane protein (TIGR00529 family)
MVGWRILAAMEAVKLIAVLAVIMLALRKKLSVGITLFGAGVITALLYQVYLPSLLKGYRDLLTSTRFISLTSVIILITSLGQLLKELRFLDKLSEVCKGLYGGNKTATAILPPLVGLMPMPGGALLSAPLVGNVLKDSKYTPEFKTATNYWFRHIVEFSWPVYPGLILTEAITGLPIGSVALMQLPLSILMAAIGLIFFIRKVDNHRTEKPQVWKPLIGILSTIWPIVLAIAIYGIFKIELALAVLFSLLVLVGITRPPKASLVNALKKGLSYKLVLLVFGTLSFQTALELSDAIGSIPKLSMQLNLPSEIVIFLVCFAVGALTGMVSAFVALGYSLLAGFLYQPAIVPAHILLAYLSGYLGMMLSPTHLCLILSNEYFQSDLLKVYRELAVPFSILALLGLLLYFSPWAELFRP